MVWTDTPIFWRTPEFTVAVTNATNSFWFERLITLDLITSDIFFFCIEKKSFVMLKKIWCNNILHNSSFGTSVDWLDFIISQKCFYFFTIIVVYWLRCIFFRKIMSKGRKEFKKSDKKTLIFNLFYVSFNDGFLYYDKKLISIQTSLASQPQTLIMSDVPFLLSRLVRLLFTDSQMKFDAIVLVSVLPLKFSE